MNTEGERERRVEDGQRKEETECNREARGYEREEAGSESREEEEDAEGEREYRRDTERDKTQIYIKEIIFFQGQEGGGHVSIHCVNKFISLTLYRLN